MSCEVCLSVWAHLTRVPLRRTAWTADTEAAIAVRAAQDRYVQRTLARWRSARLDLLILPGFACPAPPSDRIADLLGTLALELALR